MSQTLANLSAGGKESVNLSPFRSVPNSGTHLFDSWRVSRITVHEVQGINPWMVELRRAAMAELRFSACSGSSDKACFGGFRELP